MNKLFFIILLSFSFKLFADSTCPENIIFTNGIYTPPKEWYITFKKIGKTDRPLLFYIATFNFDHQKGENSNRISCLYENPANDTDIEITTTQSGLKAPTAGFWEPLPEHALFCFPGNPKNYKKCVW